MVTRLPAFPAFPWSAAHHHTHASSLAERLRLQRLRAALGQVRQRSIQLQLVLCGGQCCCLVCSLLLWQRAACNGGQVATGHRTFTLAVITNSRRNAGRWSSDASLGYCKALDA